MLVHNAPMAVFVADSRHSNGRDNYRGGDADDGGDGAAENARCGCVAGDGDADADEAEDADEDAYKDAVGIMKGKMMRMRVRMGLQKETGTKPCKDLSAKKLRMSIPGGANSDALASTYSTRETKT